MDMNVHIRQDIVNFVMVYMREITVHFSRSRKIQSDAKKVHINGFQSLCILLFSSQF